MKVRSCLIRFSTVGFLHKSVTAELFSLCFMSRSVLLGCCCNWPVKIGVGKSVSILGAMSRPTVQ